VRVGKKRNLDSFLEEIKRFQDTSQETNTKPNKRSIHPRFQRLTIRKAPPRTRYIPLGFVLIHIERTTYDVANTLHIACLPHSIRESQLRELLSPYGTITYVRITQEKPSPKEFLRRSASATIVFQQSSEAAKAHTAIDGHYISEGYRMQAAWGDHEAKGLFPSPPC